jgi:hypothetical protein
MVDVIIITFNNISVIPRQSVLLVEETEVSEENHQPAISHWQTLSHNGGDWNIYIENIIAIWSQLKILYDAI